MSVIVIEPASSGVELVRAARELDDPTVVLSGSHGEIEALDTCRQLGARIMQADTNDIRSVRMAMTHISKPTAVLAGMEYFVETAAYIAREHNLPGIDPLIARRFRDKLEMRRILASAGIPVPRFAPLNDNTNAIAAVGFPAVVKPIDACGSMGVRRVDDVNTLTRVRHSIARTNFIDLGRKVGREWMIESYIPGPEFSLEGIITNDGARVVAVTRKLLGPEPYFVEIGHLVEAELEPDERRALIAHVEASVSALGLTLGAFHAEARLSPDGPRLIEIAARLGGDHIPTLVACATGISLAHLTLRSHREGPINKASIIRTSSRVAGIRFLADHTARDFRDRTAHVVQVAENHAQLRARLWEAVPCA